MGILCDHQIIDLCRTKDMITPFVEHQVRERNAEGTIGKVISYGVSSAGYDVRLGNDFLVFTNIYNTTIDPKNFNPHCFVKIYIADHEPLIIPPNSFVLGKSLEIIKMPRDIKGLCEGKSTYARCGIVVNVTPLEPEWEGEITIEISNTAPSPAKVYAGEGIMQVEFRRTEKICDVSYADRGGKYQGQEGVVTAKV